MDCFEIRNHNTIIFSDERHRGPLEVASGSFISVTLDSHDGDESWGEFMQREEALALYGWLGLMLGAEIPEGDPYSVSAVDQPRESE